MWKFAIVQWTEREDVGKYSNVKTDAIRVYDEQTWKPHLQLFKRGLAANSGESGAPVENGNTSAPLQDLPAN